MVDIDRYHKSRISSYQKVSITPMKIDCVNENTRPGIPGIF